MRRWVLVSCLLVIAGLLGYASTRGHQPAHRCGGPPGLQVFGDAGAASTINLSGETPTGAVLAIFGLSGIGLLALRRSANRH
jgi:hypothetical protein